MVVVCAGMFRSGSTWQYQVALDIARRSGRAFKAHGMPHQSAVAMLVGEHVDSATIHIVKTHTPDIMIREYLEHPGLRVLFSERDLRDVVYSMMHKLNVTFEVAMRKWRVVENARINEVFWTMARHKVVQPYGAWMNDAKPFILAIAHVMDVAIDDDAVTAIEKKYNLANQKKETARIAEHLRSTGMDLAAPRNAIYCDRDSLLHWNHIREGREGHWRDVATPEEKRELVRLCGDWLIKRGYEPDKAWAE